MAAATRKIAKKAAKRPGSHLVWAIDPFEADSETRSHVENALHHLIRSGTTIEPVYVLSPVEYEMNIELASPWLDQMRTSALMTLQQHLKTYKIKGLRPPKVLLEKRSSVRSSVKTLLNYAKKVKADTILAGTHGRGGSLRFFLGSFSETLLLHSPLPVLVVGPNSESNHPAPSQNTILFATDFGKSALPTFKKVLLLAKSRPGNLARKITLFHRLPHALEPWIQSGVYLLGGGSVSFPDLFTREEQRKKELAESYAKLAGKSGIEVEIVFDTSRTNAAEAVANTAKAKNSGLIVMAAQSTPLQVTLLGSITRQVVRSAPCPVWVLHQSTHSSYKKRNIL